MRRHRAEETGVLSLESFLDTMTNVVGCMILVAVVTVLNANDVAVSTGATALAAPKNLHARALFECQHGRIYFVDETAAAAKVKEAAEAGSQPLTRDGLITLLGQKEVVAGDHRVLAEDQQGGIAWVYQLRPDAQGESVSDIERADSHFAERLHALGSGGFAYFVVHDDSFELYRRARELATSRGVAMGWHPVSGSGPLRLSALGSLGKRVQ